MNWQFFFRPAPSDLTENCSCAAAQPLLSLLADGMASRAETRRVQAHLDSCADCRAALNWMRATHDVLATRELAPVPADLRSRCRRALAAEEALAPLPRPVPSRVRLRPAFAAALSLTVVGVVTAHFLNAPASVAPFVGPRIVAVTPRTTVMLPAVTPKHNMPQQLTVKPHPVHPSLPAPVRETAPDTHKIALARPAPTKTTLPRRVAPAVVFIAKQPAPPVVKQFVPAPKTLVAVLPPKPHPELTRVAPHDTAPVLTATNKTPDTATPVPSVQVAVAPKQDTPAPQTAEYVVPHRSDPLGSVRVQLASLNTTVARKLVMTGAVHVQASFVQADFVHGDR